MTATVMAPLRRSATPPINARGPRVAPRAERSEAGAVGITHDKFRQFTPKKVADAKTSSEVLICISADSREAVDDIVGKAQAAGGGVDPCPKQDYGFMYGRSFEDPDGHIWEVMWMDVAAATAAQSATADA